ncbi:recombination protein RecR [Clostridium sp. CAG:1193]|jgi:recombination protein RecR|nr:recombination protein RecR [Clostridium sp. CAG:1193]
MNYPDSLNELIESFKKLPGIGEKTAERLAFSVMNMDNDTVILFSNSLKNVKNKIKRCTICGNITENNICDICKNEARDNNIICVVEDAKNVISLEKMGSYNGKYHVLNGLISPMDGKGPDDISIDSLISRVKKDDIKEVIIAISPTLEGETTSLYITKLLENTKVVVSKIAYGIPMGADMEYLDPMTLSMALLNRNKVS